MTGSTAPRADGRTPGRYDLDAGIYTLRITPAAGATGVFDLTLGQPGQLMRRALLAFRGQPLQSSGLRTPH